MGLIIAIGLTAAALLTNSPVLRVLAAIAWLLWVVAVILDSVIGE
jgi:hypothetical protein